MRAEIKTILVLFLVVTILGGFSLYISKLDYKNHPLTPYSSSFDILSLFKERKKPAYRIYGYLPYWNLENMEFLELDRLTDVAYFGIYINGRGDFVKTMEDEDGIWVAEPGYRNWKENEKVTQLIQASKKFGVNFALTVVAHSDEDNDAFLNCRECWDTLLKNVYTELDEKGITDVNLNFEYVEYTGKKMAVKFSELTKYMNQELDKKYGNSNVVVSAFADSTVKERVSSDLGDLAKNSDGIFIMGYDFHRPTSDTAGPVAPIGGKGIHSEYDIETMLKDYLAIVPPNKLLLGVPYYGYNWIVGEDEKYAERIDGNDNIGFSQSQSYEAIMDVLIDIKPKVMWDDLGQVPYFSYISAETGQQRQVFFENQRSLAVKYKLVKNNGLMGVGIWALGYDGGYTELWDLLYDEFIN